MEENKVIWPGWEVVRKIGSGSFGAVYEIQRTIRGRTEHAAVKQLTIPQSKSEIAELRADGYDDESITQYFADSLDKIEGEYAMMADMKGHSNVVYCDDLRSVPHEDGFGWDIYIKMELLSPMKSALSDGTAQDQAVRLGIDICGALELCEKMQIVHRDIKPENIFVSRDGTFKLGDFGIARTMEGTTGGTKTGTYDYMAPEVYNNRPYHTQADIYSLGLVLYWLLNERTAPFLPIGARPTPSTKSAARERRFSGEALPEPANGSDALKAIVLKACAFDPKDRYQTAAEMREDLKKLDTGAALVPPVISVAPVEPVPVGEGTVNIFSGKQAKPAPSGEGTVNIFGNKNTEEKTEYIREEKTEYIPRSAPVPEEKKKKKSWLFPVIAVVLVIAILLVMLRSCGDEPAGPGETTGSTPETTQTEGTTAPTTGETTVPPTTESTVPPTTEVTVPPTTAPEQTVPPTTNPSMTPEQSVPPTTAPHVHSWAAATCTEPKTCSVCGAMEGSAAGHKWAAATYTTPKTCAICKLTEGKPMGKTVSISASGVTTAGLRYDGTVSIIGKCRDAQEGAHKWNNIVSISVGAEHTVGLKNDGTVVAVGSNEYGQCDISSWRNIVAVCAGTRHTVGLTEHGTVVAVGDTSNGRCDVSSWTDIVAISAGMLHTVGLKSDGTVVATGYSDAGQCDVSSWTDIVAISAAFWQTVGLKSDGTVVATGANSFGQCNVSNWRDIVFIAAGANQTVGIRSDGTVVAVGDNTYAQCEVSDWTDMVSVAVGGYYTVGLKADGTVIAIGNNDYGQCDVAVWNE